jgi:hypothetical protein
MKIHAHIKLGFVIGLLAVAHLQMKHGGSYGVLDPEIVAAVVLLVMGSLAFGNPQTRAPTQILVKEEESLFSEKNDDFDLSA